jgi:hypothetical protein
MLTRRESRRKTVTVKADRNRDKDLYPENVHR